MSEEKAENRETYRLESLRVETCIAFVRWSEELLYE